MSAQLKEQKNDVLKKQSEQQHELLLKIIKEVEKSSSQMTAWNPQFAELLQGQYLEWLIQKGVHKTVNSMYCIQLRSMS